MESLTGLVLSPPSPEALLKAHYVDRDLREIDAPTAVLDAAILRRNCAMMLKTVQTLGIGWRAHVKTHKTRELTALQVGPAPNPVRLIFSTIAEAEFLLPYLLECKQQGREVNIIYGIPPSATCMFRLQVIQDTLGPGSVGFLIDHPTQLRNLLPIKTETVPSPIPIFVKTDTGSHRAGLPPSNPALIALLDTISQLSHVRLLGFYSHNSLSYGSNSPTDALHWLSVELKGCAAAASVARSNYPAFAKLRLILSVGASPSAIAAQNVLLAAAERTDPSTSKAVAAMSQLLADLKEQVDIELHGGVYPTLDLQQIATHARPSASFPKPEIGGPILPIMATSDIAFRVLAEVLSVYPDRLAGDSEEHISHKPEVLISAGCLALGREPCKSYAGWGVIAPDPWHRGVIGQITYDATTVTPGHEPEGTEGIQVEQKRTGWIVDRVSQEHGILTWEGDTNTMAQRPLEVGQKVLVWPNHACIAGACFGWYVVVDSEQDMGEKDGEPKGTRIVDVWVRCRGW